MVIASNYLEDESPKTKCLFRLFGQLNATTVPKDLMDELESEFDEPTGITTVKAPELSLDAVLLSQDCGILYEIKHAVGVQCVISFMLSRSIRLTLSAEARSCMGKSRLVRSCRLSEVRSRTLTSDSRCWAVHPRQLPPPRAVPKASGPKQLCGRSISCFPVHVPHPKPA